MVRPISRRLLHLATDSPRSQAVKGLALYLLVIRAIQVRPSSLVMARGQFGAIHAL